MVADEPSVFNTKKDFCRFFIRLISNDTFLKGNAIKSECNLVNGLNCFNYVLSSDIKRHPTFG